MHSLLPSQLCSHLLAPFGHSPQPPRPNRGQLSRRRQRLHPAEASPVKTSLPAHPQLYPTTETLWSQATAAISSNESVALRKLLHQDPWLLYVNHPKDGTLLHVAAMTEPRLLRLLVRLGGDAYRSNSDGETVFATAAKTNPTTEATLRQTQQALARRALGSTVAASEIFKTLIQQELTATNAEKILRQRDKHGRTPLHYAAIIGNPSTITTLNAGADAFAADDRGNTALTYAVKHHRLPRSRRC